MLFNSNAQVIVWTALQREAGSMGLSQGPSRQSATAPGDERAGRGSTTLCRLPARAIGPKANQPAKLMSRDDLVAVRLARGGQERGSMN
jgi:hypothetical protein